MGKIGFAYIYYTPASGFGRNNDYSTLIENFKKSEVEVIVIIDYSTHVLLLKIQSIIDDFFIEKFITFKLDIKNIYRIGL